MAHMLLPFIEVQASDAASCPQNWQGRPGGHLSSPELGLREQSPASSSDPLTYRSPLRRTHICIKVDGFEPEDIPPGFPQRVQAHMTCHGRTVCGMTLWRGCIEVALDLCHTGAGADAALSPDERRSLWKHLPMADSDDQTDTQSADAAVLQALLASCQLHFKAGQKVWAQVEDRQYVIRCCSGGTHSTWTFQLQQQQQRALLPASPLSPAMRVDASRLLYVNPMCVLLDDSRSDAPLHLRVGGTRLSRNADLRFAALIGGEHLRCAHTIMDSALQASSRHGSASSFKGNAAACASAAIDSWVHVEVPALSRFTQPGLLNIDCREASSAGSPSVAGVLPVLLLDNAHMAMEVGQLQHEALQYANEGAAAALASLYCLITDLGQWLEWVHGRVAAEALAEDSEEASPSPAMMGDVARALLQAALLRGWKHTAAHISSNMRNLGVVAVEDTSPPDTSRRPTLGATPLSSSSSSSSQGLGASEALPVSPWTAHPHGRRRGSQLRHSHDSATSVSSGREGRLAAVMPDSRRESVIGAMLRGFHTPGDEARYVAYVSDTYTHVAQSWLLCCVVLFGVWVVSATAKRAFNYYLIIAFNSVPALAAAWCCFAYPSRWRVHREVIWLGCVVGRMLSRLLLLSGNAAPSLAFMARYGDILAGVILPQSAEWVRERYAMWFQLLDLVINTAVYHRIGLHDGAFLACFCHALVKMAFAVGMNIGIELWTRRSYLRAMERKRR